MGRKISTRTTRKVSEADTPQVEIIDRDVILNDVSINPTPTDFEQVVDTSQRIAVELFLNQSAICLHLQKRYMNRETPVLPKDEFTILKQCSEILRHLTAFDIAIDVNRAWEHLERQGYKISDETSTDSVE